MSSCGYRSVMLSGSKVPRERSLMPRVPCSADCPPPLADAARRSAGRLCWEASAWVFSRLVPGYGCSSGSAQSDAMMNRFARVFGRAAWSVVAAGFAYVFIASGVRKLTDASAFYSSLRGFALIPEVMIRPVSFWIPIIECLIGALLAVSLVWIRLAALASSVGVGVLLGFAAFLSCEAIFGDAELPCGCLGGESSGTVLQGAIRNAGFAIVLMLAGLAGWNTRGEPGQVRTSCSVR